MTRPASLRPVVIALAATGFALAATGCRQPRRSVRVGSDAASLTVKMAGFRDGDHNRQDWNYELSVCVPAVGGTHSGADDTVTFKSPGLKKGLTGCQLRVKAMQPLANVKWITETEQGVLYWTREVPPLAQDANGALTVNANLATNYNVTGSSDPAFTLKVPVKFPAAEPASVLGAQILCEPKISDVGTFARTSEAEGVFTFETHIPLAADYTCTDVWVDINGVARVYHGTIAGEAGKFRGAPTETKELAQVALAATATPPTGTGTGTGTGTSTDSGVTVNTTGTDCPAGKVFDVEKHECVAKP